MLPQFVRFTTYYGLDLVLDIDWILWHLLLQHYTRY